MQVCRVRNVLVKMELKQLYPSLYLGRIKSYGRFGQVAWIRPTRLQTTMTRMMIVVRDTVPIQIMRTLTG